MGLVCVAGKGGLSWLVIASYAAVFSVVGE